MNLPGPYAGTEPDFTGYIEAKGISNFVLVIKGIDILKKDIDLFFPHLLPDPADGFKRRFDN
jgi:hypothetical protein